MNIHRTNPGPRPDRCWGSRDECPSRKGPIEGMYGYAKVAIYSCLVNLALMAVKYYLGEASGSLALKADAVHSLADVISSLTVFLGIVIAGRKTRTFPEGLYKVENLVALLSSFFIFYAAYHIGFEAVRGDVRTNNSHPAGLRGNYSHHGDLCHFLTI